MKIKVHRIHAKARLPEYQTSGAAGADVFACVPGMGVLISPGDARLIPLGLSVELPKGWELQVRSRSSYAQRGIVVRNSPGTIDSDYRGEIFVLLENRSLHTVGINDGDRIAQIVLARADQAEFLPADEIDLSQTKRGRRGFGSTGK